MHASQWENYIHIYTNWDSNLQYVNQLRPGSSYTFLEQWDSNLVTICQGRLHTHDDSSLEDLSSEHSMGTCTWHSLTYRMRSTMGSCFVRHVGASSNSLHKRHTGYQLGCLLPCLCMPSRKQRVIHCCDEDAPGSLSIGVSAQLRVDVAADRWIVVGSNHQ